MKERQRRWVGESFTERLVNFIAAVVPVEFRFYLFVLDQSASCSRMSKKEKDEKEKERVELSRRDLSTFPSIR